MRCREFIRCRKFNCKKSDCKNFRCNKGFGHRKFSGYRKFITGVFSLALVSLFVLNVSASEDDNLQTVLDNVNQNINKAQQVSSAIDAGSSADTIAQMLNAIEEIDPSTLTAAASESAPKAGSLADFNTPGSGGGNSSIALEFAKLQLQLANSIKNGTGPSIGEITELQNKQKQVSQYIQQVRDLLPGTETNPVSMPGEVLYYMNENGLSCPAPESGLYTASDCQQIITALEDNRDQLATDAQSSMAKLQDFMGQYNSNMQNVSSSLLSIQSPSVSKGQSLFSTEGGKVNVTPAALCILGGILIGMFFMWGIIRIKTKKTVKEECV